MIFDTLNSKKTIERDIFNPQTVNIILDNHFKGQEDHSQLIFRLLMTEIWFSTFIDKKLSSYYKKKAKMKQLIQNSNYWGVEGNECSRSSM